MLHNYVPILVFFGVATALGLVLMGAGFLFGPRKPDPEKLSAYECGFDVFEDSRMKFDVRYYLVAIVFIVAAFGISNTLITIVLQKKLDIAIMKSIRMPSRSKCRAMTSMLRTISSTPKATPSPSSSTR